MNISQDDADQTKERQNVRTEWESLRKHELLLVQMLQKKADDAQERAIQLEAMNDHAGAAEARRQAQEYLQEADELVMNATDALRRKGDLEKEDTSG